MLQVLLQGQVEGILTNRRKREVIFPKTLFKINSYFGALLSGLDVENILETMWFDALIL